MSIQLVQEDHYFLVAKRMLEGKVVPFLGAGANLCGRPEGQSWKKGQYLPNAAELAAQLAESVGYPDPDDHDLMRISQYVEAKLGTRPLYDYVRDPFDALYPPTALHRFLAYTAGLLRERNVPRQVILTTNYDDALERAFADLGEPYDLIWYEAKGPDRGRFIHERDGSCAPILLPNEYDELEPDERTVIVKLHGAMVRADRARDSYVITEDDYIRYLTRSDIARQLPVVLRQRLTERHLLFLGYSMRDWNLRVVLERLGGSDVLVNQSWSVQREPATPASTKIELTLWGDRDVDLVFMLLDEYVDKLTDQLGCLATAA
ncbi:MAG: SIR2 family protein [Solirubrobacteraceae bacterium]